LVAESVGEALLGLFGCSLELAQPGWGRGPTSHDLRAVEREAIALVASVVAQPGQRLR
jgi:hypothetical protein